MLFKAIRYLTITVFQLMTILEGLLIINKVTNIFPFIKPSILIIMNTQSSIQMMQSMKLTGMADAYQAITQMPLDKQPHSHECIATIIDAEQQLRRFKRSNMYIRLSKLRYQANIKDISYQPSRNLNQQTIAASADCSYILRAHNIIVTGATGCGKSFITCALGYQACLLGYRTLYFNMNRFCELIAVAKLDGTLIK